MKRIAWGIFFSLFYLLIPHAFAQDANQASSDSGVLVSPSIGDQGSDQSNSVDNNREIAKNDDVSQNPVVNNAPSGDASNPPDEIVVKSTDALMLQVTENIKLPADKATAVRQILEENIAKVRNLQLSLEKGTIDGKTMYAQREQLESDENNKLSQILNSDQMKIWLNIQNPQL